MSTVDHTAAGTVAVNGHYNGDRLSPKTLPELLAQLDQVRCELGSVTVSTLALAEEAKRLALSATGAVQFTSYRVEQARARERRRNRRRSL